MTVRQFEISHLEAIPVKLPLIRKVTCFCTRSIYIYENGKDVKKRTDRDFARQKEKEFLILTFVLLLLTGIEVSSSPSSSGFLLSLARLNFGFGRQNGWVKDCCF